MPEVLFKGVGYRFREAIPTATVSRASRLFLMLKGADADQSLRHFVVVRSWFEELKRRIGAGRK